MGTNRNYKANRMESVFMQNNIGDWLQEASQRAMSSSKKDRNRGASYSAKEVAEKQYARMETEDERQYQQEFYDRNYSFQGQVNQMQEAGLNPSLMYGQMGSTASSGSSADTTSAPASSPQEDSPMGQFNSVTGLLTSLLGIGSQAASVGNDIENGKINRSFVKQQTKTEEQETKLKEVQVKYSEINAMLDQLMKISAIDKTTADTALARYQVEINKGIDPKIVSKHIINMYGLEERLKEAQAFESETKGDVNNAMVSQIHANVKLIQEQTSSEPVKRSLWRSEINRNVKMLELIESEKDLNEANKAYTDALKDDKEAQAYYDKYCNEHHLPKDNPMVVSCVMELNRTIDYCEEMLDVKGLPNETYDKLRKKLDDAKETRDKVYDNINRVAKGNMTKAERTKHWSDWSIDAVKATAMIIGSLSGLVAPEAQIGKTVSSYARNAKGDWYESGRETTKYYYEK